MKNDTKKKIFKGVLITIYTIIVIIGLIIAYFVIAGTIYYMKSYKNHFGFINTNIEIAAVEDNTKKSENTLYKN